MFSSRLTARERSCCAGSPRRSVSRTARASSGSRSSARRAADGRGARSAARSWQRSRPSSAGRPAAGCGPGPRRAARSCASSGDGSTGRSRSPGTRASSARRAGRAARRSSRATCSAPTATWSGWPGGVPWRAVDAPLRDDEDGDGLDDDADGDGVADLEAFRNSPGAVPDPWWRGRVGGLWLGAPAVDGACIAPLPFGPRATPPQPPSKQDDRSGLFVACPLPAPTPLDRGLGGTRAARPARRGGGRRGRARPGRLPDRRRRARARARRAARRRAVVDGSVRRAPRTRSTFRRSGGAARGASQRGTQRSRSGRPCRGPSRLPATRATRTASPAPERPGTTTCRSPASPRAGSRVAGRSPPGSPPRSAGTRSRRRASPSRGWSRRPESWRWRGRGCSSARRGQGFRLDGTAGPVEVRAGRFARDDPRTRPGPPGAPRIVVRGLRVVSGP